MKINELIVELDKMASNKEREDYLLSIRNNPLIGKRDLTRIAANILIENRFIQNNYRLGLIDLIKTVLR